VAGDGGATEPLVVLLVEDLPDLPGLLRAVPGQQLVELGALGRAAERGELGGQPAVSDALGAAVRQLGAELPDLGHDDAHD
jgi:hypothetical protein